MKNVLVLMTTHNRREICETSLRALVGAAARAGLRPVVFLANSGKEQVRAHAFLPGFYIEEFEVLPNSFWAQSMRLAWTRAITKEVDADLVLWLNEDVILDENGLEELLNLLSKGSSIAVGSCRTRDGEVSYGGLTKRSWLLPLHFLRLVDMPPGTKVDSFNGNVVLTRYATHKELGGFPAGYTHLRADIDFGLTASKRGHDIAVTEQAIAICDRNKDYLSYSSLRGMPLKSRFRELNQPKFGPVREHVRFSLRHGGFLAPLYAAAPVIRAIIGR